MISHWKTLTLALIATGALAQDLTPPPLVPAEAPPPQQPQQAQPPADAQGVLKPPAIANAPLDASKEPPGRGLRMGMSLLIGAGLGTIGAVTGGFIGPRTIANEAVLPLGNGWTGAAIGWAIAVPLGVVLSGRLFDGDGSFWATLLGDVLGAAVGVAGVVFGGTDGTPLLFALPLGGAVIGYEATSHPSRVVPTVSIAPNGTATIGVVGAF